MRATERERFDCVAANNELEIRAAPAAVAVAADRVEMESGERDGEHVAQTGTRRKARQTDVIERKMIERILGSVKQKSVCAAEGEEEQEGRTGGRRRRRISGRTEGNCCL